MDRHTDRAFERLEIIETGRRRRWSEDSEGTDRLGEPVGEIQRIGERLQRDTYTVGTPCLSNHLLGRELINWERRGRADVHEHPHLNVSHLPVGCGAPAPPLPLRSKQRFPLRA